jgi:hypothetical protein
MNAAQFGQKIAKTEELFKRHLRNVPQSAPNTIYTFGSKLAATSYSSCHMPNSPTNKKHTTSASPAVLEADEQSEEIGQPKKTETTHNKSVVSAKVAAREFGAAVKAAADPVVKSDQSSTIGPHANRALKSMVPGHQKRVQHGQSAMTKIMGKSTTAPVTSMTKTQSVKDNNKSAAYEFGSKIAVLQLRK